MQVDPAKIDVIAPNLKRRYSGVTSTVIRLVPVQAQQIAIATTGPILPEDVPPEIRIFSRLSMTD